MVSTKRHSTELDLIIGKNIRHWRMQRAVSQQKLGDAVNVSFQQIQKYENGTNRLSIGKFLEIAEFLDVQPQILWKERRKQ